MVNNSSSYYKIDDLFKSGDCLFDKTTGRVFKYNREKHYDSLKKYPNNYRKAHKGDGYNKCLVMVFILLCMGCSPYQVVQEVDVNLYHLHNPKTNEVQIIITKQKLKVGNFYRLKQIDIIPIEDSNKKFKH